MPTTNTAHLDLDRIDLRILRLVLILSNTQSLTKTAAAMKLSVSQASRLLADARAIFGTEIFSRHGPQMVPSPQLLELLPRLQNVFKALDSLLGGASTLNILESSEVIRIAAVDNTAMVFIMPFLKELHQRAPKLGIEIVPLAVSLLPDWDPVRLTLCMPAIRICLQIPRFVSVCCLLLPTVFWFAKITRFARCLTASLVQRSWRDIRW